MKPLITSLITIIAPLIFSSIGFLVKKQIQKRREENALIELISPLLNSYLDLLTVQNIYLIYSKGFKLEHLDYCNVFKKYNEIDIKAFVTHFNSDSGSIEWNTHSFASIVANDIHKQTLRPKFADINHSLQLYGDCVDPKWENFANKLIFQSEYGKIAQTALYGIFNCHKISSPNKIAKFILKSYSKESIKLYSEHFDLLTRYTYILQIWKEKHIEETIIGGGSRDTKWNKIIFKRNFINFTFFYWKHIYSKHTKINSEIFREIKSVDENIFSDKEKITKKEKQNSINNFRNIYNNPYESWKKLNKWNQ